jgi:hypothetical protein
MLRKLVTRHDRYHMHKILGLASLVSFVYHYCVVWPLTGALGASWPVLLLHLALSCTGLQFTVPATRIKKWPTIIWEEYRLHAVVFSFRAVVVAALDGFPRVLGIAAVHLAADEVTCQWGQPGNTTVRGDGSSKSRRMWWVTRSYAVYQYLALASHLVGTNTMDLGYNTFIAIQSSAFCMTLHRKGLISYRTHSIVYLVCIAMSAAFILQSLSAPQIALALVFGYGRMQGLDKYPLWLLYWATTIY